MLTRKSILRRRRLLSTGLIVAMGCFSYGVANASVNVNSNVNANTESTYNGTQLAANRGVGRSAGRVGHASMGRSVRHGNVAAVLVVGLGCEEISAFNLAKAITKTGKPATSLIIQEVGGLQLRYSKVRRG